MVICMKRRFYTIVVALLIAAILSACGSAVDTSIGSLPTTETNLTETAASNTPAPGAGVEDDASSTEQPVSETPPATTGTQSASFDISSVPAYNGRAYVTINGNIPYFSESDKTTTSFEKYSSLDRLGRCGVAFACVGKDIMPTEERGSIGSVKPSGWHTIRYEFIDGRYLYNRCHLIGYQLTGENANTANLITGTRELNVQGMLPFENDVAEYVERTSNHVLYRVTPVFEGNNLLATGVLIEALSVEDNGKGVCFNVFCYNEQPGIVIDHATGDNYAKDGSAPYGSSDTSPTTKPSTETPATSQSYDYVGNKNTKKFHYPSCSSVDDMKEKNKAYLTGTRDYVISLGYSPCGRCHP